MFLVITDSLQIQSKVVFPTIEHRKKNTVSSTPLSLQSTLVGLYIQIMALLMQPTQRLNPVTGVSLKLAHNLVLLVVVQQEGNVHLFALIYHINHGLNAVNH